MMTRDMERYKRILESCQKSDSYSECRVEECPLRGCDDCQGIKNHLLLEFLKWVAPRLDNKFHVIDNRTGLEADAYEIALHEDWAKDLCYCDMEGFAILEDGTLILADECGVFRYCPENRFEIRPGEYKYD